MTELTVGVIGAGLISQTKHLPALEELDQVRIVGVCDLDGDQAREAASRFGAERSFTDPTELLQEASPDVVDICTPPKTHAPIAIQALRSGCHVLIEKPMCQTVHQCDQVMRVAEEVDRKICVAHSDLFYPSFRSATDSVASGMIGDFRGMHIHLSTPVDYMTSNPDHWAHSLPGGVIGETGPHVVYMVLSFIPRIVEVQVAARKVLDEYPWSLYEDYRLTLVGEETTATANLTYTTDQWAAQVELWGSDATVRIDLESQTLIKYRRRHLSPLAVGLSALSEARQTVTSGFMAGLQRVSGRYVQTHHELMRAFFDAIRAGRPSPVPATQGRESIRVMNMISSEL